MRTTPAACLRSLSAAFVVLAAAACGGPGVPTAAPAAVSEEPANGGEASAPEPPEPASGASAGADAAAGTCTAQLERIYDAVEGLEGEEWRAAVMEFAEQEDGSPLLYGSSSQLLIDRLTQGFTEATGIEILTYVGGSNDVLRRMEEERNAGGVKADLVFLNDPEITIMARQDYFAPLQTPTLEEVQPDFAHEDRAGFAILHYAVGYNTNSVTPEELPTTWEEVLTFDGDMYLEEKSWDWFATIMNYFMDAGMTEDDALELFTEAASRAQITSGRTATVQQLIAGGADLSPTLFINGIEDAADDGAPVAWQPPVQPMPGRSNDVAIFVDCLRPAKSLLFSDYVISEEGQLIVGELNYTPVSKEPVETFDAPIHEYDAVRMDIDMLIDERDYWEEQYVRLISGSERVEAPAG